MTRNYIFLFLCTTIITISLVEGFFGQQGVIINHKLNQEISAQQKNLNIARLELQNLEYRLDHMWDFDSLLDNARAMGYAKKGENVYYFVDAEGQPIKDNSEIQIYTRVVDSKIKKFGGASRLCSAFIGIFTASCLIIFLKIGRKSDRKKRQYLEE